MWVDIINYYKLNHFSLFKHLHFHNGKRIIFKQIPNLFFNFMKKDLKEVKSF